MRLAKLVVVGAVLLLVISFVSSPAQAGVSFSAFYSNLSPYGSWQVSAQYGRVWQPVEYHPGWNPYYDGHWVYSDLGWTWVSDYAWGAIPYHYGTWVPDPNFGWVWMPGYTWAPSWVVFRTGPDYIGWAPVSPGFSVGFSAGFGVPTPSSFLFVSAGNFLAPHVRTCVVPQSRATIIVNNTHIVNNLHVQNNVVVNRGPDPRIIERASGRQVREVPIERVSRVMPGPRMDRAQLRVDPERARHGLRVAEPVSANRPIPAVRQRQPQFGEQRGVPPTRDRTITSAPNTPRMSGERNSMPRQYGMNPRGPYPTARERNQAPWSPQSSRMAQERRGPVAQFDHAMPQERTAQPRREDQRSVSKSSPHKGGKRDQGRGKD